MTFELFIDIIASIIGIVSIVLLLRLNKKVGGKMSSALRWFIAGIVFMIFAFIWSASFGVHMAPSVLGYQPPVDVHHTFMTIGMIFFIFSARKFSSLVMTD